ncbi:MAG: glutaminyl-peptide cyclotransferase [Alistipes sp.]|nr:glutaminyl-peptide cyclotransferase [Alistipes sp.]
MVKKLSILVVLCTVVAACGGGSSDGKDKKAQAAPKEQPAQATVSEYAVQYDYRVVATYPHSDKSYTQGLQYVDGVMWEGTGQKGESHLQRIDLKTGAVDIVASLPITEFGEGITHHKEYIYQLTWEQGVAHVYDKRGKQVKLINYTGEGWGITSDGQNLYMSDGSSNIYIVDDQTFKPLKAIDVKLNTHPLDFINEMEWIDGRIWANVYLYDLIVIINPATGIVEGYVDMSALRTLLVDNPAAEAFNGIAYNPSNGHIYVTGKQWNRIFEIEVIK